MYQIIAWPLEHLYQIWPNYAGAIALLTLVIMIVLMPLTLKSTRSMLAMQKLQPEIKKLQNKHRDDRQKQNEEMMKFYQENGINPVAGCLPMLLQMPVFFFLYRTIYQLLNRARYGQDMGAAVARASSGKNGGVYERFGYFQPKHLDTGSRLYQDLSHTRQMRSLGLNLADSATKAVSHGFSTALPFIILVLGVTATSFYQQKQIAGRNTGAAQANPQQAMLMKIMPLFFAFISLTLPAGIVVYFFVSNLFRIGQQALITRTMYGDEDAVLATTGRASDKSSTAAEGSGPAKGFRARMAQLAEDGALPQPTKKSREAAQTKAKPAGAKPATAKGSTPAKSSSASAKSAANGKKPSGSATQTSSKSTGGSPQAPSRTAQGPSRSAPQSANRSRNKKKRK